MAAKHHRGVDRIVAILEEVARARGGRSLTELAKQLEAPLSSVQQLVSGLTAAGYLSESNHRYYIGPGVFALTMAADWSIVAPVTHEHLQQIATECDSRIALAVISGLNAVYIDSTQDAGLWDISPKSALRRPLLTSASGKVLLGGMTDPELYMTLHRLAESNPQEHLQRFLQELPEIRATGLAWSYGGSIPGLDAVATGVPKRGGGCAAALVASGPSETMRPRLEQIGERLREFVQRTITTAGG